MNVRTTVVDADSDYECDTCGWDIGRGESMVAANHGDHWEVTCLKCEEDRKDKIPTDAEIVAAS